MPALSIAIIMEDLEITKVEALCIRKIQNQKKSFKEKRSKVKTLSLIAVALIMEDYDENLEGEGAVPSVIEAFLFPLGKTWITEEKDFLRQLRFWNFGSPIR